MESKEAKLLFLSLNIVDFYEKIFVAIKQLNGYNTSDF